MGVSDFLLSVRYRLRGRMVRLHPRQTPKGSVLISYVITPFLTRHPERLTGHSNYWEAREIANLFLSRGYVVDVIDLRNTSFIPKRAYDFVLGAGDSIARLRPHLSESCVTVFHATESYWQFNNEAELARLAALQERRGVILPSERLATPHESHAIANETCIIEGNGHPRSTYEPHTAFVSLPLPSSHTYAFPEHRAYASARRRFLWFGGAGVVHKGLDIALEAFSRLPECELIVCGKIGRESAFAETYREELFHTPNITLRGWIDPESAEFAELLGSCIGVILDSCAEGCAGSVVLGMHGGLIPIVSRAAGVEVGTYGIELEGGSVEDLCAAITTLSCEPERALYDRSLAAWEFARSRHTRERYTEEYRSFVSFLEAKYTSEKP